MSVILALDPGMRNYGYAVLEVLPGKVRVLQCGRIFTTVTQLTNGLTDQFRAHADTLEKLLRDYSVTHLIIERYMSRRMGGVTIEAVNLMIGGALYASIKNKVFFRCIPSSQWKNASNRASATFLAEEYSVGKKEKITPHTIDAVMIGLFGISLIRKTVAFETHRMRTGVVVNLIKRSGMLDIGVLIKPKKKTRRRK